MSNAFLVDLFEHKAWRNRGLIAALRAAPADADRIAVSIAMLTLEHTGIIDEIFMAHLTGAEPAATAIAGAKRPDLDNLAARLAKTDAWYIAYAARATPAELESAVDFTFVDNGDAGRMTKGQMLAHVITHGASHHAAINKMLEAISVRGAPDMVTTFEGERQSAV